MMAEIGTWPRSVKRLVFEWSFTKERSVSVFAGVVGQLERDGWAVNYDGRGGAWEEEATWPHYHDILVFAAR